ncbi:hypothetical protein [Motilibacter aurantiacus]|uniref:hypothetical protein n=1 Tax=Motilibacter aurantiacus TaxID=2714955 RepID=UPI0014089B92|nr:hypothetical protein [Motilibacter aurantiacus]NHC47598.1 hypothetical protein [Motilibacter aurantiacus]
MQRAPEQVWSDISGEVAYALAFDWQNTVEYFDADAVLMSSDARDDDATKVDQRKRFLRVFESERRFVCSVWSAAAPLLADGPLIVLFDIDQTLGSRKGREGESATLVRPCAAPLMGALRDAGAVMGIITTRGITDLHSNLADTLHLGGVADYLDPRFLTGAEMERYAEMAAYTTSAEVPQEQFSRFRAVLAPPYDELPAFRELRDARGRPLPAKDLDKLLQLAAIREEHPGQRFLVVDDRDYAGLLAGAQARVVGVHLTEAARAHY